MEEKANVVGGTVSIEDFIRQIERKFVETQAKENKLFYKLQEVRFEVTFALDVQPKASGKLFAVSVEHETRTSQAHKVTLKLTPLKESLDNIDFIEYFNKDHGSLLK